MHITLFDIRKKYIIYVLTKATDTEKKRERIVIVLYTIVEIQIQKKFGFEKRVLYYTSKAYVAQLEKGDYYPKLNQVIYVGIVDFGIFEGNDYLTRHLILNAATLKQELKDLEFNFI
ncbi:MAG: PD-(D/E)XK nuclease family transposase [Nitrospirae bacterium]|nr:PD-(D/E)XK nuclease family transposase [Nitrospirota bacterium]